MTCSILIVSGRLGFSLCMGLIGFIVSTNGIMYGLFMIILRGNYSSLVSHQFTLRLSVSVGSGLCRSLVGTLYLN